MDGLMNKRNLEEYLTLDHKIIDDHQPKSTGDLHCDRIGSTTYHKRKEPYPDCPICGHEMGHIGRKAYYCVACMKEVRLYTGTPRIYDIDENGIAREVFV